MLMSLFRLVWAVARYLVMQLLLAYWLAFDSDAAGIAARVLLVLAVPGLLIALTRPCVLTAARFPPRSDSWRRFEDLRNGSSALMLGVAGHYGWALLALAMAAGVVFNRRLIDAARERLAP